jgi:hypothetical protein
MMRSKWFWATLIIALSATLYVQIPAIVDPYRVDDDLRQYFWMARFQDPDVFPDDHLFYNIKRVHVIDVLGFDLVCQFESLGFGLLYQFASILIPPLAFNKVLPFILMAVCVAYLFALGRSLTGSDPLAFFLALLFVLYSLSTSPNISPTSGLERSFQFLLLIVFMYYLIRGSPLGITATLVVQVLFYTPTFVVSALTYALSLLYRRDGRVKIDLSVRQLWPLVLGAVLAALALSPALYEVFVAEPATGDLAESVPAWQNPLYSPEGRVPIFPSSFTGFPWFLLVGYGGLARIDDWYHALPLLALFFLTLVARGAKRSLPDWRVNALLVGSLLAWSLCWLAVLVTGDFVLRYPFKYANAPLPLWILFYCALNSRSFLSVCAQMARDYGKRWPLLLAAWGGFALVGGLLIGYWLLSVVVGACVIIAANLFLWRRHRSPSRSASPSPKSRRIAWGIFVAVLLAAFVPRMKSYTLVVAQEQRPLLEYVVGLPKDVLIAGAPEVASNIPLFAQRRVLFSSEISYVGGTRVLDFFDAYYADSTEPVLAFCRKYDLDYLIVDERHFSAQYLRDAEFFYDPFNESIVQMVAARSNFVLPTVPDNHRMFQSGPLFVVPCDADMF